MDGIVLVGDLQNNVSGNQWDKRLLEVKQTGRKVDCYCVVLTADKLSHRDLTDTMWKNIIDVTGVCAYRKSCSSRIYFSILTGKSA